MSTAEPDVSELPRSAWCAERHGECRGANRDKRRRASLGCTLQVTFAGPTCRLLAGSRLAAIDHKTFGLCIIKTIGQNMPLNIKNPEADNLARLLAKKTGRTITDVVVYALREQLRREEGKSAAPDLAEELMSIGRHCASLPDRDLRPEEELLGYNELGIWS